MRIVQGYQLKIQETSHLSEEEYEHVRAKVAVFAVSLKSIFGDPILIEGDSITTHYKREDYARETLKHVEDYLQSIKMTDRVAVTFVEMKLSLYWDKTWETGK